MNARTRCISTERPQGIAQETERPASNAGRGNCQYPTPAEVGLVTDPLTVFMIGPRHVGKCGSGGRSVPSSPLYCRSCLSLPPAVATNSLSCLLSRHAGLDLCDIDGELECLCFRADSYLGSYGRAASLLRGDDPVIAVHK